MEKKRLLKKFISLIVIFIISFSYFTGIINYTVTAVETLEALEEIDENNIYEEENELILGKPTKTSLSLDNSESKYEDLTGNKDKVTDTLSAVNYSFTNNQNGRTKAEIVQKYNELMNNTTSLENSFAVEPVFTDNAQVEGTLSDSLKEETLNTMNYYRYLAGLNSSPRVNETMNYNGKGAVLLSVAGFNNFSHTPSRPSNMTQDFYNEALYGTNVTIDQLYYYISIVNSISFNGFSANISGGTGQSLPEAIKGLLDDDQKYNIAASEAPDIGHRVSLLNPYNVGYSYGMANSKSDNNYFSTITAFEKYTYPTEDKYYTWPCAGYCPNDSVEGGNDIPWSITMLYPNTSIDLDNLKVELTYNGNTYNIDDVYYEANDNINKVDLFFFIGNDLSNLVTQTTSYIKNINGTNYRFTNCIYKTGTEITVKLIDETNNQVILTYPVKFFSISEESIVDVTSVTLNKTSLNLNVGDTFNLVATVLPDNATDKTITWKSSNTTVATVSTSGKVTAVKAGTSIITATSADGKKSATCTITVTNPTVNVVGVNLNKTSLDLKVGESETLQAIINPTNATNQNVTWNSSNTSVATVSTSGKVIAVSSGTATITVTTEDGNKTSTCKVTVTDPVVSVTGISLNRTSLSLKVGNTSNLYATITPSNATNQNVTWKSSNSLVATVDSSGKVTGVKVGTAIITVTTVDGNKTATCQVTVASSTVSVSSVSLNKTTLSLTEGDIFNLVPTIYPSNATNQNVTWKSSNTSVATVDASGKVTGVNVGTATITVTTVDGNKTATCQVTVTSSTVNVSSVSLNKTTLSLVKGDEYTLVATVLPTNATNKNVIWNTSNSSIATVDVNGKVKGISSGSATITVITEDGNKIAMCTVTVTNPNVSVTGVSLNKSSLVLYKGEYETLIATVLPTNATNKNVTWKSSNTTVATVSSSGKVTAVKSGRATITVTTVDGSKKATCVVNVKNATVNVTSVSLNRSTLSLKVGNTETLTATVLPTDATNKSVTWKSSNTSVATVDSNGKVTAVKKGTATITVTTVDGSKTATCSVTVTENITGVTLNKTSLDLIVGDTTSLIATIQPSGSTTGNVTWSSSNSSVVSVDANGKVTALKEGTAIITVTTVEGNKQATCSVKVSEKTPHVNYNVLIQGESWKNPSLKDGEIAQRNVSGHKQQAMIVWLSNVPSYGGGIEYNVHMQNVGWQGVRADGAVAGIAGTNLRTEALRIRLTGEIANHYDVYYRVHISMTGWLDWAKNYEPAGSSGLALEIQGLQIVLVKKGENPPECNPAANYDEAFQEKVNVMYMAHIENVGNTAYVRNGATLGYIGKHLRMEGIKINVEATTAGNIEYTTHIQNRGWLDVVENKPWSKNGEFSGTVGSGLRLEGIKIRLTGDLANKYDVYYRIRVENQSNWQDWTKNGGEAGSSGKGLKLEAIQVRVYEKGSNNAPQTGPNAMLK